MQRAVRQVLAKESSSPMERENIQAVSSLFPPDNPYISYQLYLEVKSPVHILVGRLGYRLFPRGRYVYTGSARKNMRARILRHISARKKNHWHIDYLLSAKGVNICKIIMSDLEECRLNRMCEGEIVVKGFGSTDCHDGCGSHLKFIGDTKRTNRQTHSNVKSVRHI